LDVEAGEVVLLSGANGSGKTTLLRLLAGWHQLHTGTGVVLGHDLSIDRRGARRTIGLLGHDTGCYDDLTVRKNLRYAVRATGRDASASDNSLERVGLTAQADVVHGRLSAGQPSARLAVVARVGIAAPGANPTRPRRRRPRVLDAVVATAPTGTAP
jgi:ABC-type multidrug transport system ATPase subunit